MHVTWRVSWCLILALVVGGAPAQPQEQSAATRVLQPGMTPAEVRQILGPPHRVARQVLYHRYLEQWVYETRGSCRVEFDCSRGQAARLVFADTSDASARP
jgi:hypothetical protein